MKKRLPKLNSDAEAEKFLKQDLSGYLHAENFKPATFEYAPKDKTISLRLSGDLLTAIKSLSKKRGIPYQRFVREALEQTVRQSSTKR